MKLSPLISAGLAALYICAVVLGIQIITGLVVVAGIILIPILILSLLVLSVAVMAFLFFFQPIRMLLDGRPDDAMRFFFKTILTFAGIVLVLVLLLVATLFA